MEDLSQCRRIALVLAVCVCVLGLAAADAMAVKPTLKTIRVDGDLDDWTAILTNPNQVIPDGDGTKTPCATSSDLDCPVQSSGRDLRTFAWTYDDTYLYVYVRRQEPNPNSMVFWFYLDLDLDAKMGSGDRVFRVKYQGSNRSTENDLYAYVPASPEGDAMTDSLGRSDGYTLPGALIASSLWSEEAPHGGGPKGFAFEERVPWARLGAPPGTPVTFHVSSSNSPSPSNINQQIDDNLGGNLAFSAVSITPDSGSNFTSAGSLSTFTHEIRNEGNRTDTFRLRTRSSQGLSVTLTADTDCDGLGDELMAEDANGDGDLDDPGDFLAPAWDTDGDGAPDTAALAPGEVFCIVVEIETLPGMEGLLDETTVTATSTADSDASAQAVDVTRIGDFTLLPDQEKGGVPGQAIPYPFEVCNSGGATTVDLTAFTELGFPSSLHDDPECDGTANELLARDEQGDGVWDQLFGGDSNADGNPDTGNLSQGSCACYVAFVEVPSDATIGTRQISRIVGESSEGRTAEVRFTSRIASRVEIFPDYTFADGTEKISGAGKSVFFSHTVRNNWIVADEISLSGDNDHGWTVRFWTDPNGDGNITDGVLVTRVGPLAPNGGEANIVAEVRVPSDQPPSTTSTTTVTARSVLLPSETAMAVDQLAVSVLATYADPLFTFATRFFGPCDTIYVEATGLRPSRGGSVPDVYDLLYYDAADRLVRFQDGFFPSSEGVAQDSYTLQAGDPAGPWILELREEGQTLATLDLVIEADGAVDPFHTERDLYPPTISALDITSWLRNRNQAASFRASTVAYLVLDPSGSLYLQAGTAGTFEPYTGVETTRRAQIPPLPAGASVDDSFVVRDVTFPSEGVYTLTAVWRAPCGTILAQGSHLFSVGEESICDDGIDNDGDGLVDCDDPECTVDPACIESICDDGVDNDGDGPIDCADPDCAEDPFCLPESDCGNGIDDDGDGAVDCADDDCLGDPLCPEVICDDGIDNDGDGLVDCADPDCDEAPGCFEAICDDGVDNDGDGFIDCDDFDCSLDPACGGEDCANGVDDDGDGRVDCDDLDCSQDPACIEVICDNGIDDDGDGQIDCDDPDCFDDPACPELICDDGVDNDGDGQIDCDDEDCAENFACTERECADGVDNDGDGQIDCDDEDCASDPVCPEVICDDGIDNDGDGLVDCADPNCSQDVACHEAICDDGVDNDGDGLVDCEDPDCREDPNGDCDGDGVPNDTDCAPADPGAFAVPPEVSSLRVRKSSGGTRAEVWWTDVSAVAGSETVYDVSTGGIGEIQADDGFSRAVCFQENVSDLLLEDPRSISGLDRAAGFWYLVRAQNACGVGPWGFDSRDRARELPSTTCAPR